MTAIDQIKQTINANDVVLFMKGTKMMPQCGFSSRVAGVLNFMGIEFADVNVLADADIRQGIKDFSDWPTIPQLYVKGAGPQQIDRGHDKPPVRPALGVEIHPGRPAGKERSRPAPWQRHRPPALRCAPGG
jgi:Grx4 family monothiol glutaredoxin